MTWDRMKGRGKEARNRHERRKGRQGNKTNKNVGGEYGGREREHERNKCPNPLPSEKELDLRERKC